MAKTTAPENILDTPPPVGESVLHALGATTPYQRIEPLDGEADLADLSSEARSGSHRYTFAGEIARGGMGAVLRGRDHDLGREVAVKVMLEAHQGKSELLQRFVEEAQIAGQLQHPAITPVYELGRFPDRRPYFSMKLVRGQTLARLLRERPEPGQDRARFLKAFEQVCQAVAYAHARGVIHRDLKPHNIMVGSFGEVQVMDWGLAKVLATGQQDRPAAESQLTSRPEQCVKTLRSAGDTDIPATQLGSVLGTPAYMAPEQARGEVETLDERCDVFGLGAILCEILTGDPPYLATGEQDVLTLAQNAELTSTRARLSQCGADHELIAMAGRCLNPEREQRPRNAGVLADELTAYLNSVEERLRQAEHKAIEARTQAAEEGKRRRLTLRLSAIVLVTLLAGLISSLWLMRRALDAEELAKTNEKVANEQRTLANNHAGHADRERQRAEGEKAIALAVKHFLQAKLLTQRDATEQANQLLMIGRSSGEAELDPKISVLLARAAEELAPERIEANFPGQPLVQAELLETVGLTYRSIGGKNNDRFALAISFLERAAELRRTHNGPASMYTLTTLNNLASAFRESGKHQEALRRYQQISKDIEAQQGPEDPDTLTALNNLAQSYDDIGNHQEALKLFQRVGAVSESRLGLDHPCTLRTLNNLAAVYVAVRKPDEAIKLYEKVRAIREPRLGSDHPDTLLTLNDLGEAYQAARRIPEARRLFHNVLKVREARLGPDHPETLTSLANLASVT
jgi:serine/threonine protein kinase